MHQLRAACRPFTVFRIRDVFFTCLLPFLVPGKKYLYVVYSNRFEILVAHFTCFGSEMMGFGFLNPPRLEFVGTLFPPQKIIVLSKMLYAVINLSLSGCLLITNAFWPRAV